MSIKDFNISKRNTIFFKIAIGSINKTTNGYIFIQSAGALDLFLILLILFLFANSLIIVVWMSHTNASTMRELKTIQPMNKWHLIFQRNNLPLAATAKTIFQMMTLTT
jgi:hypothetical protein